MKFYYDGSEITEQQANDMEAAGQAHVVYGSSGGNTPDGSGEPWMRLSPGPNQKPSCLHHRIDNNTWQCVECGERMITQRQDAKTVLSAPNAAACNNPACRDALDAGTYDETNPPAGCANPHGFYVADRYQEREVVIGWDFTYQCERCRNGGDTIFDSYGAIWGCGMVHRGQHRQIQQEVSRQHHG
jgi:hypothetical protein